MGCNTFGRLGRNTGEENSPKRIELKIKIIIIKGISCGKFHSLFLFSEGDKYEFGCNESKELGINTESDKQILPLKLNNLQIFKEIASHWRYQFFVPLL